MSLYYYSNNESISKESINNYENMFEKYIDKTPTLKEALIQMFYSSGIEKSKYEKLINEIFNEVNNHLDSKFNDIKKVYPNITYEDAQIISSYTCELSCDKNANLYKILNNNLVAKNRKKGISKISKYLFIFLKSLRKLKKSYYENLYRCISVNVDLNYDSFDKNKIPYLKGKTKIFWAFTSTSKKPSSDFLGFENGIKCGTIFSLNGNILGYDINLFNVCGEEEILLEPEREMLVIESIPPINQVTHVRCEVKDTPLVLQNIFKNKKKINKYNKKSIYDNNKNDYSKIKESNPIYKNFNYNEKKTNNYSSNYSTPIKNDNKINDCQFNNIQMIKKNYSFHSHSAKKDNNYNDKNNMKLQKDIGFNIIYQSQNSNIKIKNYYQNLNQKKNENINYYNNEYNYQKEKKSQSLDIKMISNPNESYIPNKKENINFYKYKYNYNNYYNNIPYINQIINEKPKLDDQINHHFENININNYQSLKKNNEPKNENIHNLFLKSYQYNQNKSNDFSNKYLQSNKNYHIYNSSYSKNNLSEKNINSINNSNNYNYNNTFNYSNFNNNNYNYNNLIQKYNYNKSTNPVININLSNKNHKNKKYKYIVSLFLMILIAYYIKFKYSKKI